MGQIGRRVRAAVNPMSTAATRWWCHSALRYLLTGHGPAVGQRRLICETRNGRFRPSARPSDDRMRERADAIDDLLG